jgi:hypothetical protein
MPYTPVLACKVHRSGAESVATIDIGTQCSGVISQDLSRCRQDDSDEEVVALVGCLHQGGLAPPSCFLENSLGSVSYHLQCGGLQSKPNSQHCEVNCKGLRHTMHKLAQIRLLGLICINYGCMWRQGISPTSSSRSSARQSFLASREALWP